MGTHGCRPTYGCRLGAHGCRLGAHDCRLCTHGCRLDTYGCRRLVELRLGEEQRAALALDVQPVGPLLGPSEGQPEQGELVGCLAEERAQPRLPCGGEVLLEDTPAVVGGK